MNSINNLLLQLIEGAKILGLSKKDIKTSQEFLEYNEFGLCFDTIITQMYEYDVEITIEFYQIVSKVADSMKIPSMEYDFMTKLIRNGNTIPIPIKEQLAKIIGSLV